MIVYSKVCPGCGEKSSKYEEICPECGAVKSENLKHSAFADSFMETIASYLTFFNQPVLAAKLLIRSFFLLLLIFVVPDFIRESELFWMACAAYSVFGIVKELEEKVLRLNGIYLTLKILLIAYIGAAIGNFISYTGYNTGYNFAYYFNTGFLLSEISNGNTLLIIGIIAALGFYFLITVILNVIKD